MAAGEQTWCQGWSEPNAGSDLAGIQSKAVRDDAARRLAAVGPEDVDDARRVLHAPLRPVPQRSRRRTPPRPHLLPRRPRDAGRHRAAGRAPRRRRRLRRGVPRRRVRPRRRRARRAEPGLGRRDGDDRFRARPHAALPRPLHRDRATAHRPRATRTRRPSRSRRCATASSRRGSTREAYRWQTFWTVTRIVEGVSAGRGVEHGEGVLVGARRAAARARARAARPARRAARRRRRARG